MPLKKELSNYLRILEINFKDFILHAIAFKNYIQQQFLTYIQDTLIVGKPWPFSISGSVGPQSSLN